MQLLIFDFDGVLADTFADMIRFAQEACDELRVDHRVIPADLSGLEVMSFAAFGRACSVPDGMIGEFVSRCTQKFAAKPTPAPLFGGLREVIRELAADNTLVVVTGNTTGNVQAFLGHHRLGDCFQFVYGVDLPGSKVEKILMAKQQYGEDEAAVFLIGDSLSDIRAGREAAVTSVAVGWGHQSLDLLQEEKPDLTARSPEELLEILS